VKPELVSVATISWARTADEEALLRRSLPALASLGMRVVVGDAGTSESFTDFLRAIPGVTVVVPAERGLVAQVQASLARAGTLETPFILYTEPDKESFFRDRLARFVDRAPADPDVGVVLAARSEHSFSTYPPRQRYTEGVANHLSGETIGVPGDYFYGPFLMTRALLPQVASLNRALGWGWRPATFVAAGGGGLRVVLLADHHPCPEAQRAEDDAERSHRLKQLSQNVAGLVA